MANLDEENALLVRNHLNRMDELNSPNRHLIQELNPQIAGIVQKLLKNPENIHKVEQFIASITVEELKPIDKTQVMS